MFKILCPRPHFYSPRFKLFSTSAQKFLTHLSETGQKNMENALNKVQVELDVTCVNEVLKSCVLDDKPQMGLRFFIWAGLQKSSYRHSRFMYGKACEVLKIGENGKVVCDVIEGYRGEGCGVVGVKMFKVVLDLCKEAKDADLAMWVLRKMEEFDCRADSVAYELVIGLLCEKGEFDEAMELMREMELREIYPGVSLYVVMIKGLCEAGKLDDACVLMKNMKSRGCSINVVVFSCLLGAVCNNGSVDNALELLKEMEKEGGRCKPNAVTYTTLIKGFVEKGRSMEALRILGQMRDSGTKPNRVTFATLIQGLCKDGHLEEAYKVIEQVGGWIPGLYDDCHSSLFLSLWRIGRRLEAEAIFKMMLAKGLRPDGAASSTFLRGLCMEGRFLDAYLLFEEFERSGFVLTVDSDIYSTLLDGLREENHSVEAAKFARIMASKGVIVKTLETEPVVSIEKVFENRN